MTQFLVPQTKYRAVKNIDNIHPLKQKIVFELVCDKLKGFLNIIDKIIVFGSSTSMKCGIKSDIDFAVRFKENMDTLENKNIVSEIIGLETDWNYDVIWLNGIDESGRLYQEIKEHGRVVYEQTY